MSFAKTIHIPLLIAALLIGPAWAAETSGKKEAKKPAASKKSDEKVEYDAVLTIKNALIDARKDAESKGKYLSKYIEAQGLTDEYNKAHVSSSEEMSKVPLSFDEAMESVTENINKKGGELLYADEVDENMLPAQLRAEKRLTEKMWDSTFPELKSVDLQEQFVRQKGQWNEFLKWVDEKTATEKTARAERDAVRRQQAGIQAKADREKKRQQRIADEQKDWDRRVQSYQLRTDRYEATQPNYYYGDDDWYDDRYRNRWGGGWGPPYIQRGRSHGAGSGQINKRGKRVKRAN